LCQHMVMVAKTHGERIDRLEKVIQILAEDQVSLQKLIAGLATETRRGFDRVRKQFEESDKRARRTDERIDKLVEESDKRARRTDERIDKLVEEGDKRARRTDERIDKLVVAMGEFIRQSK
jgi:hypothetical protein